MRKLALAALAAAPLAIPPARAAVITPPPSDATGLAVRLPNGISTTAGAALARLQGLNSWRGAATHSGLGPAVVPAITNSFQPLVTYRTFYKIASRGPLSALKLRYCDVYDGNASLPGTAGGGEVVPANPITVDAGVQLHSNPSLASWSNTDAGAQAPLPVTFAGQNKVTIQPGMCADSDPVPVYLLPGQGVAVQTTCYEPTGKTCPGTQTGGIVGGSYDGDNSGYYVATLTGDGSTTTFNYTAASGFYPIVPGSFHGACPGASGLATDVNGGSGTGTIAGAGIASGTLTYATGAVSLTCSTAPGSGVKFYPNTTGGTPTDQALSTQFSSFAATGNSPHLAFGPQAILGLPANQNTRLCTLGIFGDSIFNGSGNSQTDVSFVDYALGGACGTIKGAISGEELLNASYNAGRFRRMLYASGGVLDRVFANWATNDLNGGLSLSQIVNAFLQTQPALAALTPSQSGADVWWATMLPRTNSAGVPNTPALGPYTAAGAAYGSGAVVSPTPLGGAYKSGTLGNGIKTCTITGTGITGPYTCSFGTTTMPGSLWSDGATTPVVDTGAGGTGATTLTGAGLSTGTHTPSTGAVSLTLSSALSAGKTISLYAFASGPSGRNAWNYFLYNWAVPLGYLRGVVDTAACVETSPGSATGSGGGTWANPAWTADFTHPSPTGHQTILPGCIGPSGTSPSAVWMFSALPTSHLSA